MWTRREFIEALAASLAWGCGDMAARSPSSFSTTEPDFRPREPVLASDADNLFNDQQFILDKNEPVILDNFMEMTIDEDASWETLKVYWTRAPNMAGTAATIDAECSLLCWSDHATDFDIGVYHNGTATRHTLTISANHTSRIWRGWFDVTLYGDGSENELFIQLNNNNSPTPNPRLYLAGVALFTNY